MEFEAVIGLEVHAELATESKMFCGCPVVDSTQAGANVAVCPICSGMPGVLPVVNQRAVEYALRVALALECEVSTTSIFARKNYFYPDLPKGYQISQYEHPLARNGHLRIFTSRGEKIIRIRRVHLEEDTGKLTHVKGHPDNKTRTTHTLVDLNRAGIPLLEIVSEPDLRSAEDVRTFATSLRTILRYLGVNSGDMQKGVMRVEPNVSVRPVGRHELGTRTEIKNLNSFRALERSVDHEIERQVALLRDGEQVVQETRGWDELNERTFPQRRKEEEDDYRYFPEPDLPPLKIESDWLSTIRESLPELPIARLKRFKDQYGLSAYDAAILTDEQALADYFEAVTEALPGVNPKTVTNWITGDLFSLMNKANLEIKKLQITPSALAELIRLVDEGEINQKTAKSVLAEMFDTARSAEEIVDTQDLRQISDPAVISEIVAQVLTANPEQVTKYLEGKQTLSQWFYGQVMRTARGKANPHVVKLELDRQLNEHKRAAADRH